MFDFLAHRAINYFSMEDNTLLKPASEFTLNSEAYFEAFNKFPKIKLSSEDTSSLKFHALKLLQDLIIFHASNNKIDALIDVDLKRLLFVRQNAVLPNKDSLYLKALISLKNLAPDNPVSAEVTYRIALLYSEWANSYVWKKNERYRWMNREALRMCQEAIKAFPGSFGAKQCANLSAQITAKTMTFTNENVNIPGRPFKILVSYKNISKVFWRQIPIKIEDFQQRIKEANNDSIAIKLSALKPIKEWSTDLPNSGDFQNHSVEVNAPALPFGHYVILCASNPHFKRDSMTMVYSTTQISRLSYIERKKDNGSQEFLILDRVTGIPLKGVEVRVWSRILNDTISAYKQVPKATYTTDKNGCVTIAASGKRFERFTIEFSLLYDHLIVIDDSFIHVANVPTKSMNLRTYFFTDRAIYRPGQTIYFKGIMLRTDGDSNEIAPKETTAVVFKDVNEKEIGQLELTSNDFGSINGSFVAPLKTLNGQMQITDGHGTVYVSVEDYKRPKFDVTMSPYKGLGKLGDTVRFTGHAKALAGGAISNAKVKYRVVRKINLREPSPLLRSEYFRAETEIASGATAINDTGGFMVGFKAVPDGSIAKSENPIFNYSISVDITDINGETRSSGSSISLGYAALVLDLLI